MRRAVFLVVLLLLLVSAGSTLAANRLSNGLHITRYVISSGGGPVEAGDLALHTTIGQAVVSTTSAGSYDLCAGFWCGLGRYEVYLPLVLRNY